MNDVDTMTSVVRNARHEADHAAARYDETEGMDPDAAQEYFEAKSYLDGMIHVLQVIAPADLSVVLSNLGVENIDDLYTEVAA